MRHILLIALPALSYLCGCHALVRDVEVIDYKPGGTPTTTVATRDASYRLSVQDKSVSFQETDVRVGSAVGFRQEEDGTVTAFAGEQSWTVHASNGSYVWLCRPKPETSWDRFIVTSRDNTVHFVSSLGEFLMSPIIIVSGTITGEWP